MVRAGMTGFLAKCRVATMHRWNATPLLLTCLGLASGCSDGDDHARDSVVPSGAGSGGIRWEEPALPSQLMFASLARDGRLIIRGGGVQAGRVEAQGRQFDGDIVLYGEFAGVWLRAFETARIAGDFDDGFRAWIESENIRAEVIVNYVALESADPTFASIQGTYQLNIASSGGQVYTLVMTFDTLGVVTGSDTAGCAYYGQLAVIDPTQSIYGLDLEASTCGEVSGEYEGLVTQLEGSILLTVINAEYALDVAFARTGP